MRDPAAGDLIKVSLLADHLTALPHALNGITISGGEPFAQADALAALLNTVRQRQPDWNVIIYSGYRLSTIRRNLAMRHLLAETDILIDGRYRQEVAATHPLAGSGNQAIHFLNSRGKEMTSLLEDMGPISPVLGIGRGKNHLLIGVPMTVSG
jgi:anaerobic ribonucleoside-triphosphate reductase activating protein